MSVEIRLIKDFKHNLGSFNTVIYNDLKTINGAIKRFYKCYKSLNDFDFIEIYQYSNKFRYNEELILKSLKKVLPKTYFNKN